jgi:hypothetical protein
MMKTSLMIGVLFLAAFLSACASKPGPNPNVVTSRVVNDEPDWNNEGSGREQVQSRRKSRITRAKRTPRQVQVEGELATTPNVGSPEWERAKAADEEKERRLDHTIRNICRGC